MHTGDVCGVACVWCVPVVCALCMCTGGPGLRGGQGLAGGSSSGAQVGVFTLSPARTPTRTCRVAAQKLRCRNSILIWTPTAAAERGGGRRREGERGVGSQPKGGGASAEGWGHLAAWAGEGEAWLGLSRADNTRKHPKMR